MATLEQIEKAKERLAKKALPIQRILASEDGQAMMKALREEFLYVTGQDHPHGAGYRAGAADVIAYLMQVNDFGRE